MKSNNRGQIILLTALVVLATVLLLTIVLNSTFTNDYEASKSLTTDRADVFQYQATGQNVVENLISSGNKVNQSIINKLEERFNSRLAVTGSTLSLSISNTINGKIIEASGNLNDFSIQNIDKARYIESQINIGEMKTNQLGTSTDRIGYTFSNGSEQYNYEIKKGFSKTIVTFNNGKNIDFDSKTGKMYINFVSGQVSFSGVTKNLPQQLTFIPEKIKFNKSYYKDPHPINSQMRLVVDDSTTPPPTFNTVSTIYSTDLNVGYESKNNNANITTVSAPCKIPSSDCKRTLEESDV